jgi:lipopolysaccharide assembly outer membrane protein LptD (OstA)
MTVILIFANVGKVGAQSGTTYGQSVRDSVKAVNDRFAADTGKKGKINIIPHADSLIADSLILRDTAKKDSAAVKSLSDSLGIRISPDALSDIVISESSDSAVLDMSKNIFYLYGNAKVKYQDMQLEAGRVIYNQGGNMVTAAPLSDTILTIKERPSFTQGQEKVTYDSMQYNFKSKRAIIRNAHSQYGEGFVYSKQVKRNPDQTIYGLSNVYTTCALDTPHFGIVSRKIKIIPGKVVAAGASNLYVEQVPTPLFLPFGLFPISAGQRSGFILPTYTIEEQRGIGLLNGGYYFNLSEYTDVQVHANIYTKGSYELSLLNSYKYIYHYYGGFEFKYAYNKTGENWEPNAQITKDFKIRWDHHSDPKSRPGVGFNATVDAGTSTYNKNNTYTVNQILQNQFSSSIAYSKAWQNKPYTLSIAARHSQNTQSRLVDVTLPELSFYVAQFNPFQKLSSGVSAHWYDKVTMSYSLSGVNKISFYDSAFSFNSLALDQFQNGIVHKIPISASYNVLRFINVSFSANYQEYWLTRQLYRYYNFEVTREDTNVYHGFYAARDFNAGVNVNTRIYGMKLFKKGKIAGIRHVITPSAGFTYTPDYAKAPFRYGYQTRITPEGQPVYFPVYEGSVPAVPGYGQFGKYSSLVNFGIDNNLQMKMRTEKDMAGFKNISLIDNFRVNSAYNLAADSFNWSNINMSFATNILNHLNITATAVFDPYPLDTAGRRLRILMWDAGQGIARFTTANISLGGNFHSKPKGSNENNPAVKTDEYKRLMQYGLFNDYLDFNISWNFNFTYSLQVNKNYLPVSKKDTIVLNHFAGFGGDFNLTQRWKVAIQSGYNFTQKKLTLTSINIYRDLHCWQMSLGTIPFGPNKNYNFTLNVKASVLQDMKLMRRRDYHDIAY